MEAMGARDSRAQLNASASATTRQVRPPSTTARRRSRGYRRVCRWTLMRRPKMWVSDRSSWFTPQWAPTSRTTQLEPIPPSLRLFWMLSRMKPLGRYG